MTDPINESPHDTTDDLEVTVTIQNTQTVSSEIPVVEQAKSETPQTEVSDELVVESKGIEEQTKPDLRIRAFLEGADRDTLISLLNSRKETLGEAQFNAAINVPGSYDNLLALLVAEHSIETDRNRNVVSSKKDNLLFSTKFTQDGKTVLGVPRLKPAAGNGTAVAGRDARAAFAVKSGRLKRIPLYNSGFFVDIAQPRLAELNAFFNSAYDDTASYGKQFGAYFFYFNALLIKEAIVGLIGPLILNSNLKNYERGDTLLSNIKLVDLKLLLNGAASLMYKNGFDFTHVCTNPSGKCTHSATLTINVGDLARHDFKKLPNANIRHMAIAGEVNTKNLAEYHASLDLEGQEIRFGEWGFTFHIPSISEYIEYGKIFNGMLQSFAFAENPSANQRSLMYSYYRVYAPWVSKLTLYNQDGSVDHTTLEREAISDILVQLQEDDAEGTLSKAFVDSIANAEISHLCYPAKPCPQCGYVPGSGYYTVDPENTFFIQSLTKLTLDS